MKAYGCDLRKGPTIRSGNTDIDNDSAEATMVMVPLKWGWHLQNGDCRDTHCTNGVDRGRLIAIAVVKYE